MSIALPPCPACQSTHTVKNGIHNFKCREYGRPFVGDPQNKPINQRTKTLIETLLLEKIPLAGIARVVGVSEPWLQSCINVKYEAVPQ